MKSSCVPKPVFLLFLFSLAATPVAAGQVSVYYLPENQVEYEGLGYRTFDQGHDIKLKPHGSGMGLRWRHELAGKWTAQMQYWRNNPFFAREDGNARDALNRQTGQTRIAVQNFMADVGRPLHGSRVAAVAGLQGVHQTLDRRDIVFNGAPEPGSSRENLEAAGAYFGFRRADEGSKRFYGEWEFLIGHFFKTRNSQTTGGGSVRREGYSYTVRLEAGCRLERWKLGLGFVRHTLQVHVPGGATFPSGAARSFPINKTDFFSPFLSLTYVY